MLSDKRKWADTAGCIGLAVVFLFYFYLVSHTPMFLDDYNYSFCWGGSGRCQSLADVFTSLRYSYFHTNGRIPLHFFSFTFLMLPKVFFNLFASAVFTLLGILIYYHGFGSLQNRKWHGLFLIYMGLYFLVPDFAQSFLWLDGTCNYLFGITIVLAYLVPWRRYAQMPDRHRFGKTLGMFLCGILAGWTNENLCLALLIVELGYLVLYRLEKRPLRLWMAASVIGTFLGMLVMLTAPGNAVRAGEGGLGNLAMWLGNIKVLTVYLLRNFWELMAVWLVLLALVFVQGKCSLSTALYKGRFTILYLLGAGVSVYSMCVVEYAPPRTWSIMAVFCILTVSCTYRELDTEQTGFRYAGCAFLLALLLSAHFPAAMKAVKTGYRQYTERVSYIESQKAAGNLDVIVPGIYVDSPFSVYNGSELSKNSAEWPNWDMALYYGLHSLTLGSDYGVPLHP